MESGYRLVFSGRTIYNEIDVLNSSDLVGIGTIAGCKARFSKDIFNQDFLLTVSKTKTGWHLVCEAGVCFQSDSDQVAEIDIQQGDFVSVCSVRRQEELFKITCLMNYDDNAITFDAWVNLRGRQQVVIGNTLESDLKLLDLDGAEETVKLENAGSYLRLVSVKTSLGVYVNGNRVVGITRIKDHDFISCGPYTFYFNEAKLYISNSDCICVNGITLEKVVESESALVYPRFNRNTRVKSVLPSEPIGVLDPPDIPQKPTESLIMTLLPSVVMLVLMVALREGMGASGGLYILFSVCTMALGIFTSVANYRKTQKNYQDALEERETTYKSYISLKREEIIDARKYETDTLMKSYPSAEETLSRVERFSGDLFDRTLSDDDFLHTRVGVGKYPASRKIDYKPKETLVLGDELQAIPGKLAEEFENLQIAPIVVDLKEEGVLGVVGCEDDANAFLKIIVEDLCTRQYYQETMMFAVCTKDQAQQNAWMRFIPHFQKGNGLARNIACDKESCEVQFEYLFKTLTLRDNVQKNGKFPAIVVFVLDQMGIYTHPVSKYLEQAKSLGVYFVFLSRTREELPLYCGKLIELQGKSHATLIDTADQSNSIGFDYENLSDEAMWKMALKLAPVYCEDVSVEGNLPKSFSLFALLGIQGADDLDLGARWKNADITKSMAAPLGLKTGDEVVVLDLHEKYHGPHGLVAGTTGSGKSEILQTYVLSMASLYSPEEVGFVIIDFKGGGMANLFAKLPHLVGAITDIDGKEMNRSLMSIKAEIDKRKRWFKDAKVNNIGDYIRKYKNNKHAGMKPLPHLVLIIDEFAELKADQPEFMKEVISAARVGRSLGIHLILATQKPAGVIDDQIWSNSRFKMCLKVQSSSDSNEVLKSPLAAEIREPGRAYLQVGNNEIFDLFQSAYSGCPAQSEEMDHINPFVLYEVDDCGRRKMIFEQKAPKVIPEKENEEKASTQLQAITLKIAQYCSETGIQKLPSICLPPLKAMLLYPKDLPSDEKGMHANIGIYDDPSKQYQGAYSIDLTENNLMIIGSARSGKTNMLQNIIRSISTKYTPDEAVFYVIDFASMMLKNYENLNHVGGVVTSSEDEKLKNLFKLLHAQISLRKERLLSAGVSSFAAYRDAGHTDLPQIYLVIDNLTALIELYLQDSDTLLVLVREGLAVGISTIVANAQTSGIGYRYFSNFSGRIALSCNDTTEYANLFDYVDLQPSKVPGRCVVTIDRKLYECQTYLAFDGEREIDRVREVHAFIERVNANNSGKTARKIPEIPGSLKPLDMRNMFGASVCEYQIPVGVTYTDVEAFSIDLRQIGVFGVSGSSEKYQSGLVHHMLDALESQADKYPVEVHIIDDVKRKFAGFKDSVIVKNYTLDAESALVVLTDWHARLEARYQQMLDNPEAEAVNPLLLMVIQNNDAAKRINDDYDVMKLYTEITTRYRSMGVCIIFANYENTSVSYDAPEPLRQVKQDQHLFFYGDLDALKPFDAPYDAIRENRKKVNNGDAYYIRGNDVIKLKMIDYAE